MENTKKQLLAKRAQAEAALLKIEEAEEKAEYSKRRDRRDEWCAKLLGIIEDYPQHLNAANVGIACLEMNLYCASVMLERLLAEDR